MTDRRAVRVGVTCVGGRFVFDALQALRAAPDLDVTIIGMDAVAESSGKLFVDRFVQVPFASQDPRGFVKALFQICQEQAIDVVVLWSEAETRAVAQYGSDRAPSLLKTTADQPEVAAIVTHKGRLFDALNERGVDVGPYQRAMDFRSVRRALEDLGYPERSMVIKPCEGTGSRGVLIANATILSYTPLLSAERLCGTGTIEALEAVVREYDASWEDVLIMPFYGGDVYDVDCLAVHGTAVDVVPRKRQYSNPLSPVNEGCVVAMEPDLIAYAKRLGKTLGVHGVCDFDLVRDEEGRPRLLDASLRMSGSIAASCVIGINFPAQLIRILLDLPLKHYDVIDGTVLRPIHHFIAV
ncbi:hypothetical protein A3I45_03960 [Candidatus Uhrbacteria bacterium RIFCSPLOWO2_02_FULL_53_10]|uniref:ATP-grasp domain-containing protein n=1 Tax=Candidatus Uhrbacteria bacterium RIFCSPLOWO2_02_FULL_53_10 TaxID=1802411 RepID=A0A1F7VGX1_9BACT|nr:MAG: hypothetical protein A3I45_03960 [Candidatus Uhrbacteria bacterium RIFCSPLOWO2_02_FULL_53_10]